MERARNLDNAQIVLLATQLIAESNLGQLELLASENRHILTPSLVYLQLLNYLPPDTETLSNLIPFLKHLDNDFKDVSNLDEVLDQSSVQNITLKDSRQRLRKLRLDNKQRTQEFSYDDDLATFIVQWLRKVEAVCGMPTSALQLLEPFVGARPKLTQWQNAYLIPLIRLQDQFYPGRAENLNTETIERVYGLAGVKMLLQFAEQDGEKANIGRDLEEVVAPWVQDSSSVKRRRLSHSEASTGVTSWRDVNEWIYATSHKNFKLAAKSFLEWDGPQDEPAQDHSTEHSQNTGAMAMYVQTGISLIATSTGTGHETTSLLKQILERASSLSVHLSATTTELTTRNLSHASKADLLENSILRPTNPVTYPREEVFTFLDNLLEAQTILGNLKISLPVVALADTALFGSEERQKQELLRFLQQVPLLTRSDIDWPAVRRQLYVLLSGKNFADSVTQGASNVPFLLGRVPMSYLESEFLNVLIMHGHYTIVNDLYIDNPEAPLNQHEVQEHIVSAIYAAYDNASNGNRTRGGMKRAYDMLKAFQPKFPLASAFVHIDHLIRATNSLSFYQLTLQHGVPFQPATIRIHHDPLSLIEKVLAQNHKAFTKLDDLIEIGRNLVLADAPNSTDRFYSSKSMDERLFDAQHRITYLAITSALADDDFDTAYSYITTRLATSPSQTSKSQFTDDTSWRAAYAAGKYRPSSSPKSLHDRITGLSKRMDLLSLALTLVPAPEPLSEILATWRRCEEEIDSLKSQALDEERAADAQYRSHSILPGGFTEDRDLDAAETRRMMERRALGGSGPTYEEDAPMGLFDVARGAASAFRKSAFPLSGTGRQVFIRDRIDHQDDSGRSSMDEPRTSGEQARVRKRDMVSNMVTGGLVSGMSWVLGAAPPKPADEK